MQMRAAQCMGALRPLIAKFFNVPELDMADKINIGRANIFSILCAGASSWHELNQIDIRCFHTKVMKVWRSVTGTKYMAVKGPNPEAIVMTDQQLLDRYELMAPMTMVRMLRLNLLIRVVLGDMPGLLQALYAAKQSQKSWLKVVEKDFEWIQGLHEDFAKVGTIQDWF